MAEAELLVDQPTAAKKIKLQPVRIAVTSRALFNLNEEHKVFKDRGLDEYLKYQKDREDVALEVGPAYGFIEALQMVNSKLEERNSDDRFDVVLLSRNHAGTGLRFIRSITESGLPIKRMALTDGNNPVDYLDAYGISLFLSCNEDHVSDALRRNHAAAKMIENVTTEAPKDQLRIAFDLDAVLFSKESDVIYHEQGLEKSIQHEHKHRKEPLKEGPLKNFAEAIGRMQRKLRTEDGKCPIRVYFVTARGVRAGERPIRTLTEWGLELNEAHFLHGAEKGPILSVIKPHIFFDDSVHNIESATRHGVVAGHIQ